MNGHNGVNVLVDVMVISSEVDIVLERIALIVANQKPRNVLVKEPSRNGPIGHLVREHVVLGSNKEIEFAQVNSVENH